MKVSSAVGGTAVPFTVGQALKQGEVPSGANLVADVGNVQSVIKNRWPDGSAKFAILSGRVDLTANTPRSIGLSVGTPSGGTAVSTTDLQATGMSASVQFGSFGTASWGSSDWASPAQTVISGPEMSAFTYRKPIGSDPHLVAWLEVRTYKGGKVEVLPWIENGYLKVANPGTKSGTAVFTLGGAQRVSTALTLIHHQRAVLAAGTTLTHWYGTSDPAVTPQHNTAYLMASKLVPNYAAVTPSNSPLYGRLPTSYTPLGQASYPAKMGDTGYDPSIGLLPEWDVAYLSSGGDPRAYRGVIINGYSAGRYGIHYRDETTNRPLVFASYPNLAINPTLPGISATGGSTVGDYTPTPTGSDSPPNFSSSHHPSMGYFAYLISGWNYFLEENQFLATALWLKQVNTTRQGAKAIIESSAGANQTRGASWSLRSIMQAATITPDADTTLRAQFTGAVTDNILYYQGRYVATANNPLGIVQPYDVIDYGYFASAAWQDDFMTATMGWMKELQAHASSANAALDALLAWKYNSVVGRLGSGAPGTFNYRYGGQFLHATAPGIVANYATGVGPWFANWGAAAVAMAIPPADGGTSLQGTSGADPLGMATGYWGNLHPALAYAVDHAAAGADAAYTRLTSASNYAAGAAGFANDPVWSVKPRSR